MTRTEGLTKTVAILLSGMYGRSSEFNMPQARLILKACQEAGLAFVVKDNLDLENEATMARIWPSIFDGSLSPNQYYDERERYLAFIKLIQEEIKEAGFRQTEEIEVS